MADFIGPFVGPGMDQHPFYINADMITDFSYYGESDVTNIHIVGEQVQEIGTLIRVRGDVTQRLINTCVPREHRARTKEEYLEGLDDAQD